MSPNAALWVSIVMGSCAQVFLKRGVTQTTGVSGTMHYLALFRSAWVWAWAACFVIATGLWLVALSTIQVSYAFPLLSMGYVIVAVLSIAILRERVPALQWVAIGIITIGVALICKSA
jgi:drug/metabolite transporter (DMT)-like permease